MPLPLLLVLLAAAPKGASVPEPVVTLAARIAPARLDPHAPTDLRVELELVNRGAAPVEVYPAAAVFDAAGGWPGPWSLRFSYRQEGHAFVEPPEPPPRSGRTRRDANDGTHREEVAARGVVPAVPAVPALHLDAPTVELVVP